MFKLVNCKTILVIGAGHGIGFGIVNQLINTLNDVKIFATYNNAQKATPLLKLSEENFNLNSFQINPLEEGEHLKLKETIGRFTTEIDLIINCVGFLHDDKSLPEKSLKDIDSDKILEDFKINTIPTLLVAKCYESMLSNDRDSVLTTLSAKVGSIEDNRMGGWYGYRMSKAALNMACKNIAIELKRKKKNCSVIALHPGTTDTDLSRPFTSRSNYKLHTIEETAENILYVLDGLESSSSGSFLSWNGEELPW